MPQPVLESTSWLTNGAFYDDQYVGEHTHVPDVAHMPHIIGWSGPARCGSTALLFVMASQPGIDRAYFQPQKSLIRNGGPDFVLRASDTVVATKEVFGLLHPEENYDPVGHLLRSGVPAEHITWISTLREPTHSFASWLSLAPETTPQLFAAAQTHTLQLYEKYRDTVHSIPFAYDLLAQGEHRVLSAVLAHTALAGNGVNLVFDAQAIKQKTAFGQADDPDYFAHAVQATIDRGEFRYGNSKPISDEHAAAIGKACMAEYQDFYAHSRAVLGLDS